MANSLEYFTGTGFSPVPVTNQINVPSSVLDSSGLLLRYSNQGCLATVELAIFSVPVVDESLNPVDCASLSAYLPAGFMYNGSLFTSIVDFVNQVLADYTTDLVSYNSTTCQFEWTVGEPPEYIQVSSPEFTADAVDDTVPALVEDQVHNGTVASNDVPCNIGAVSYSLISGSTVGGSVTSFDTSTGAYTFTPSSGFLGIAEFQYNILCNGVVIDSATVSLFYINADALDDNIGTVPVNLMVSGVISPNDILCNVGVASFQLVASSEVGGTVSMFNPSNGAFEFTPTLSYVGTAGFSYELLCNGVVYDSADVIIEYVSAIAVDDQESVQMVDTSFTGNVSSNDQPCSSGVTTYQLLVPSVVGGVVSAFNTVTGDFTFDPSSGFLGQASFDYHILCNGVIIDSATVTIPYVTADALDDLMPITPVGGSVSGVVSTNDIACSTGVTTYSVLSGSEVNGTITSFDPNTGSFTFAVGSGTGNASFDYQLYCEGILFDTATVTIPVVSADAVDDDFGFFAMGSAVNGDVSLNDTFCSAGSTTYQLIAGSETGGVVSSFSGTAGTFTFNPAVGFIGTAGFSYEILCNGLLIDTGSVSFVYISANANDDFIGTFGVDAVVPFDVSSNDSPCTSGSTVYQAVVGSEIGGTVSVSSNGTGVFTPSSGFTGTAQFVYEILCMGTVVDTATVTIFYLFADAVADMFGPYDIGIPAVDNVSTNDVLCTSPALTTYALVPGSEIGGILISFVGSTGGFTFIPAAGFTGVASFSYEMFCDGVLVDTATVMMTYTSSPTMMRVRGMEQNITASSSDKSVLASRSRAIGVGDAGGLVTPVLSVSEVKEKRGFWKIVKNFLRIFKKKK